MDENELKALFRDAPGEAPQPTFDTGDIVRASKRATARRRNGIAVACSALVLVLAGVGMFGVFGGIDIPLPSAAKSNEEAASAGQPGADSARPLDSGESSNFSNPPPQQGGSGGEKTGQMTAEGTYGCDQVDRELATALAGELPVPVDVAKATPGDLCSTAGRYAGFPVPGGTVSAGLFPAGQGTPPPGNFGTGAVQRVTPQGAILIVVGAGPQGPPMAIGDVVRIADAVATRF